MTPATSMRSTGSSLISRPGSSGAICLFITPSHRGSYSPALCRRTLVPPLQYHFFSKEKGPPEGDPLLQKHIALRDSGRTSELVDFVDPGTFSARTHIEREFCSRLYAFTIKACPLKNLAGKKCLTRCRLVLRIFVRALGIEPRTFRVSVECSTN
jgi:hypothetical protein